MTTAAVVLAGAVGAILGSFANVVVYRLPRDESIVMPRSRCPHCGTPIAALDNIPILSYLLLRGRCRACGAAISARYPLVEGLMAGLAAASWLAYPDGLRWVQAVTFCFLMVAITFIDLDHQLILDRLTYPGMALGLVFSAAQGRIAPAAASMVGAAGLISLIIIISRGGMGGGDVKLAGVMGAFLGWPGIAVALFAGFMAGGTVGLTLLALRLRGRKDMIPFGPALAFGGLVALFWTDPLVAWYWP